MDRDVIIINGDLMQERERISIKVTGKKFFLNYIKLSSSYSSLLKAQSRKKKQLCTKTKEGEEANFYSEDKKYTFINNILT